MDLQIKRMTFSGPDKDWVFIKYDEWVHDFKNICVTREEWEDDHTLHIYYIDESSLFYWVQLNRDKVKNWLGCKKRGWFW